MSFWAKEDDVYHDPFVIRDEIHHENIDDTYIDSENIEEQIACFKAEYAYEMSSSSQLKNEIQKLTVRKRRREAIIEYYDDDDHNHNDDYTSLQMDDSIMDIMDIDQDYKNVMHMIQLEETQRLENEEEAQVGKKRKFNYHQSSMTMFNTQTFASASAPNKIKKHNKNNKIKKHIVRARAYSAFVRTSADHVMYANILYQVPEDDLLTEKQWMRCLRNKKFKLFVNKHRKQRLQRIKKESEQKLQELEQQIHIKQRIKQLNNAKNKLETLRKSRITLIQKAAKEIDGLRNVIQHLSH